jgi:hypothetical protein
MLTKTQIENATTQEIKRVQARIEAELEERGTGAPPREQHRRGPRKARYTLRGWLHFRPGLLRSIGCSLIPPRVPVAIVYDEPRSCILIRTPNILWSPLGARLGE